MKILLVEDDPALLSGLTSALRRAGYCVDGASSGEAAEGYLCSSQYAAMVLDLGLPKLGGQQVLRNVRSVKSSLPILIISARDAVQDRIRELDAGADDYLVKPFGVDELEARLRALIRRHHFSGLREVQCGSLIFDIRSRRVRVNSEYIDLSRRELELLEILLRNQGRILSKEQILGKTTNDDREIGFNAIEVGIHRLRRKIAHSGARLSTIRGLGYMLDAEKHL